MTQSYSEDNLNSTFEQDEQMGSFGIDENANSQRIINNRNSTFEINNILTVNNWGEKVYNYESDVFKEIKLKPEYDANQSNPMKKALINLLNNNTPRNRRLFFEELDNLDLSQNNMLSYFVDGTEKVISINNRSMVNQVKQHIRDGFITEEENEDPRKSDNLVKFKYKKITKFDFITIKKRGRYNGRFFPYTHNTIFTKQLKRYQIFTKDKIDFDKHCLIKTLELNKISDFEIEKISKLLVGTSVPRSKLKEIGKLLNCEIHLRYYDLKEINSLIDKHNYDKNNPKKIIKIALYEGHYFIDEVVKYHRWLIHNQDSDLINTNPRWREIRSVNNEGKGRKNYSTKYCMTSLQFVRELKLKGCFNPMKFKDYNKVIEYQKLKSKDYVNCPIIPSDLEYNREEKASYPIEFDHIVFADFECSTDEEKHKAYMVCYVILSNSIDEKNKKKRNLKEYNSKNIKSEWGSSCAFKFLNELPNNSLTYFHNLKYDLQQFQKYIRITKPIIQNSNVYQVTGTFKNKELTFRCSNKMITAPLKKFPQMFKLDVKKEIFPYDFYKGDPNKQSLSYFKDAIKYIKKKDKEEFAKLVKETNCLCVNGKKFDHMKYAEFYCKQDVNVLAQGFLKFRGWFLDQFKMDVFHYTTLASESHNYFIKKNCYKGVKKITGTLRKFLQEAVVGGRVMTYDNKPTYTLEPLTCLDANSLYPSAMFRIKGFPKGLAKLLIKLDYEFLKKQDYYVVEIKITKVNKKMSIPCFSYKDDNDKRIWSNEVPPKNIIVDQFTLEDCIKYHDIEFEIIRGVYWNEGFNNKICKEIKKLYDLRQKYKKEKNPIEQIYKLKLNTAYGKTIMKESISKIIFVYGIKTIGNYAYKNCNMIKSMTRMSDEYIKNEKMLCYQVEIFESILEHTNMPHCGAMVLGMSKRIMNELTYACQLCNSNILYCDTDSAHIQKKDIKKVIRKFRGVFGRELIGNDLGQFKHDFEIKGCENVIALSCVYVAPKVYCAYLMGTIEEPKKEKEKEEPKIEKKTKSQIKKENKKECKTIKKNEEKEKPGDVIFQDYFRCKGISPESITHKVNTEYKGRVIKMYMEKDKEIIFDLLANGQVKFDFPKSGGVSSKRTFEKRIYFPNSLEYET